MVLTEVQGKIWLEYGERREQANQFSSVVSNSLQPHGLQHARLPCSSPTPGVYPSPCPLSWWCHPTISSSVVPFSSCPQSFRASGSFPMSRFFTSGGQSIGVSASASGLPKNIKDWFPFGWTGWISLQSKGLSRVFSNTTVQKHQFFSSQLSLWSNSHIHTWLLENQRGCFFISVLVQDVYSFCRALTGTMGSWAGVWCGDTETNEQHRLALDSVLGEDWARVLLPRPGETHVSRGLIFASHCFCVSSAITWQACPKREVCFENNEFCLAAF